jgi:uncharacterized membrane protein YoaT (DUF817 family)
LDYRKIAFATIILVIGALLLNAVFYFWYSSNQATVTVAGMHPYQLTGVLVVAVGIVGAWFLLLEAVVIHVFKK